VSSEKLSSLVKEGLEEGAERKAYIYADARSQYGVVQEALQKVREAGVENVAFIAIERNPSVLVP
jgi:biopolymer transport protein ExbD